MLTAGLRAKVMLSGASPGFYAVDSLPLIATTLYDNRITGMINPDTTYTLTWQSPDNQLSAAGVSWPSGYYYLSMDNPLRLVAPGNQIRLQTSGRNVSTTVPLLSAEIDLALATVRGKAPPNSLLQVNLSDWDRDFYDLPDATQVVTSSASGEFTAAFPQFAPLTRAWGSLVFRDTDGHHSKFAFASPYLEITINGLCLSGSLPAPRQPFVLVHQLLSGAAEVITGTAYAENGLFGACLQQVVRSGDQVTLESPAGSLVMQYTVPELFAEHDFGRQVVTGFAPPQAGVVVNFYTSSYSGITRRTISGADGAFGIDTSDLSLKLNDYGIITYNDPAGAIIRRYFAVSGYQRFFPFMPR
jgi:hypothetical protein